MWRDGHRHHCSSELLCYTGSVELLSWQRNQAADQTLLSKKPILSLLLLLSQPSSFTTVQYWIQLECTVVPPTQFWALQLQFGGTDHLMISLSLSSWSHRNYHFFHKENPPQPPYFFSPCRDGCLHLSPKTEAPSNAFAFTSPLCSLLVFLCTI